MFKTIAVCAPLICLLSSPLAARAVDLRESCNNLTVVQARIFEKVEQQLASPEAQAENERFCKAHLVMFDSLNSCLGYCQASMCFETPETLALAQIKAQLDQMENCAYLL